MNSVDKNSLKFLLNTYDRSPSECDFEYNTDPSFRMSRPNDIRLGPSYPCQLPPSAKCPVSPMQIEPPLQSIKRNFTHVEPQEEKLLSLQPDPKKCKHDFIEEKVISESNSVLVFLKRLTREVLSEEELKSVLTKVETYREKGTNRNFLHLLIKPMFKYHIKNRFIFYDNFMRIKKIPEGQALLLEQDNDGINCLQFFDQIFLNKLEEFFKIEQKLNQIRDRFFDNQPIHKYVFETTCKEGQFVRKETILHYLIRKLFRSQNTKVFKVNAYNIAGYIDIINEQLEDGKSLNVDQKNAEGKDVLEVFKDFRKKFDAPERKGLFDQTENLLKGLVDNEKSTDPSNSRARLLTKPDKPVRARRLPEFHIRTQRTPPSSAFYPEFLDQVPPEPTYPSQDPVQLEQQPQTTSKAKELPTKELGRPPTIEKSDADKTLEVKEELAEKILDNDQIRDFVARYGKAHFENLPIGGNKYIDVNGGLLSFLVHCLYNERDINKIIILRENLKKIKKLSLRHVNALEKKYMKNLLDSLGSSDLSLEELQIIFTKVMEYRLGKKNNNFLHILLKIIFKHGTSKSKRPHFYNNLMKAKQIQEGLVLLEGLNSKGYNCFQLFDKCLLKKIKKFFCKEQPESKIKESFFDNQCFHMMVFEATSKEKGFVKKDTILHFLINELFKSKDDENIFGCYEVNIKKYILLLGNRLDYGKEQNIGDKNSEGKDAFAVFKDHFDKYKEKDGIETDYKFRYLTTIKEFLDELESKFKGNSQVADSHLNSSLEHKTTQEIETAKKSPRPPFLYQPMPSLPPLPPVFDQNFWRHEVPATAPYGALVGDFSLRPSPQNIELPKVVIDLTKGYEFPSLGRQAYTPLPSTVPNVSYMGQFSTQFPLETRLDFSFPPINQQPRLRPYLFQESGPTEPMEDVETDPDEDIPKVNNIKKQDPGLESF